MGDTSIRLSEEAKDRLDLHKREDESYEDVILRLTRRDRWAGFGVLSETETETRAGLERIREQMRAGMTGDVEDGG